MGEPSATRRLARHAAETRYDDLPDAVVQQAKRVIRDSLGCLLGGARLAAGQRMRRLVLSHGAGALPAGGMAGEGEATVAGSAQRATAPVASYVNAYLINLLDFDDTMAEAGPGHPGATVIPAALALGESLGLSGRELITAVVVGYDVHARVGGAGRPSLARSKQVRGLATWQVFGAAGAAVAALGLDAEAASRAFGMAALHAPVPFVGKIYEERPMWALKNNFGWSALGGVLGALFAREGLDANHDILEGETGFWAMAGSDRCDFAALTAGLGSDYGVMHTSFKPYPCCRFTHSTLDAVNRLVEAAGVHAGKVRSVRVRSSFRVRAFADYRPRTFIDGQFSLPYVIALSLLRIPPGYAWCEGDRWRDPLVLSLADRVRLEVDEGADSDLARGHMRTRVSIELDSGAVEETEAVYARGDPRNPLTDEELQGKFLGLAKPVLGAQAARELDRLAERLEEVPSVQEVTAYLAGAAA